MKKVIEPYQKESGVSYAAGAYAVERLLEARPGAVRAVYIHPKFDGGDGIEKLCRGLGLEAVRGEAPFARINRKENTYVAAEFGKYTAGLPPDRPHVALMCPGDPGNLGTVARTLAALGGFGLAVVGPSADIWSPKVVRASMGALFSLEFEEFSSFEEYGRAFPGHRVFPFTPDGSIALTPATCPRAELYTLLFGSEAAGLPAHFREMESSVAIPHLAAVDSLNLAVSVGIGAYVFSEANRLERSL